MPTRSEVYIHEKGYYLLPKFLLKDYNIQVNVGDKSITHQYPPHQVSLTQAAVESTQYDLVLQFLGTGAIPHVTVEIIGICNQSR